MFVVVGDAHLHPYTWASMPSVRGDAYRSYEQAVRYAIENHATHFVLAGDTVDVNNPPAEAVEVLLKGINALKNANVIVLAISGNHDPDFWVGISGVALALDTSGPVKLMCNPPHQVEGIRSLPPDMLKERLSKLDPATNVLVLHQLVRGIVPEFEQSWDLDPDWVPTHVKLVLLGDLHKAVEYSRSSVGSTVTKFIYTGSTYLNSIDESDEKSFLVVHDDLSVTRVPLSTRPVRRLKFASGDEAEFNKAVSVLDEAPEGALVICRYDSRIPDVEKLKENREHLHFMFKPINMQALEVVAEQGLSVSATTLESCLSAVVDRAADKFYYDFVLALLRGQDTKQVIEAFRTRFLEGSTDANQPS